MRRRHHLQHIVPQQSIDVLHWRHNIGPLLVQCRVRGHPCRLTIEGYLMHLFLDPEGALLWPLQDAHGIGIVLLRAPQQPCQGIQEGTQRIIGVMHVRDELPLQVTRLGKAEQLCRVLRRRDDLSIDSPTRQDDGACNGDSTFELLDGSFSEWIDDRVRQWRRHNWNGHTHPLHTGQQTRVWKHREHGPDDLHDILLTRSSPHGGSPQGKENQGLPPDMRSSSRTPSIALAHPLAGLWDTSELLPDGSLVALLTILQRACRSCNPTGLPLQGTQSGSLRHGYLTPRSHIPGGAFLGFRQGELVIITTPGIDDDVRHLAAEQREVLVA